MASLLTRKQQWRRVPFYKDDEQSFSFTKDSRRTRAPNRSYSQPNVQATFLGLSSFGKMWATTGDLSSQVEDGSSSHMTSNATKARRQTRFNPAVRVVLIPTRTEYMSAGLSSELWWEDMDYSAFKKSAIAELNVVMLRDDCDSKMAIQTLYMNLNSESLFEEDEDNARKNAAAAAAAELLAMEIELAPPSSAGGIVIEVNPPLPPSQKIDSAFSKRSSIENPSLFSIRPPNLRKLGDKHREPLAPTGPLLASDGSDKSIAPLSLASPPTSSSSPSSSSSSSSSYRSKSVKTISGGEETASASLISSSSSQCSSRQSSPVSVVTAPSTPIYTPSLSSSLPKPNTFGLLGVTDSIKKHPHQQYIGNVVSESLACV